MRLAISNLAWDVAEDKAAATLLQRLAIDAIEIAPGKYFPQLALATDADVAAVKAWWADRGIAITGMQALLFGTTGLNMFGPPPVQEAMFKHFEAVCRVGAGVGATRLVFGSPKNRDRRALDDAHALAVAVPFFQRLGDIAQAHGVVICLEPNPTRYGANFMTHSADTAAVVRAVGHAAIRMQLDVGALAMNREQAAQVLEQHGDVIGHVHASEPELVPLGDGGADHAAAARAVAARLPGHVVGVEMLATRTEPHLAGVERALNVAISHYRRLGRSVAT